MKFSILLAAQVALATLGSASSPDPNFPAGDGFYETKDYLNGTIITTKLEDGFQGVFTRAVGPAHVRRVVNPSHKIQKRSVSCEGEGLDLDHEGIDGAVQKWKDLVADGPFLLTTDQLGASYTISFKSMYVTYGVGAPYSTGSLDLIDINFALWWMDNLCTPYTITTYYWDGSPSKERFEKWCGRHGPGVGFCEV